MIRGRFHAESKHSKTQQKIKEHEIVSDIAYCDVYFPGLPAHLPNKFIVNTNTLWIGFDTINSDIELITPIIKLILTYPND